MTYHKASSYFYFYVDITAAFPSFKIYICNNTSISSIGFKEAHDK